MTEYQRWAECLLLPSDHEIWTLWSHAICSVCISVIFLKSTLVPIEVGHVFISCEVLSKDQLVLGLELEQKAACLAGVVGFWVSSH